MFFFVFCEKNYVNQVTTTNKSIFFYDYIEYNV